MMTFVRRLAAVAAAVCVVASMLRPRPHIDTDDIEIVGTLSDFDLRPGSWFKVYLSDWMEAFDITEVDEVTSGICRGAESGDYIWATATPEWDQLWFNQHGWRFPRKWVPFHYLATAEGEPGDTCKLRGL